MTREHDEAAHPAPHRGRVSTIETMFSVWGGVAAWFVQLAVVYAFATTPCFEAGERLITRMQAQAVPMVVGIVALVVALAALWLALVLLRRTRGEKSGGHQHLFETGRGRTRYLAVWGVSFSAVFSALIAINILAQLGFHTCAR